MISVLVPVYQEQETIHDTITHIRKIAENNPHEIIIADGHPDGTTCAVVTDTSVTCIRTSAGRGTQLKAAAERARGDIFVILHADTRLDAGAFQKIIHALENTPIAGGAFQLKIDSPRLRYKVISFFANIRSRISRHPYGDQTQFIRADIYRAIGGFAAVPIMEDVLLMQDLQKNGHAITLLQGYSLTSPRRWEKEGALKRTLKNIALITRFYRGASPEELAPHYQKPNEL